MSVVSQVVALATRVGQEIKAVRTSVKPTTVTPRLSRFGTTLRSDGVITKIVGANAYWLALNDNANVNGLPTYPSKATVDATLDAAVAMGANSVRVHSIGISLGKPKTIMPTLDTYDATAFDAADYVIASAKKRGLYLSVPLTDRWDYYHGGAQSLVNMVMPSGQRELYRFWSEPTVRAAFDRYVTTLLNHLNPYTGLRWKDDPTLAMWEIGNEFYDLRNDANSRERHASAAALIKSLSPDSLIVDGTGASGGRTADAPGISDPNIDILTSHYYNDHAMDTAWLPGDVTSAVNANKVFMVGEYDWTDGNNGQADQNVNVNRAQWLSAIENNKNIAGDYYWTLLVADAGVHNDFYQLYYPGQNAEQNAGITSLTNHALIMNPKSQDVLTKQPLDPDLTALAALPSAADTLPYATGVSAWALTPLTAYARTLLDDVNAAQARTTLDVYSKAESSSIGAGAEMAYSERTSNFTTTNLTQGSTAAASIVSGLSVTVVGEGRPVELNFTCIAQNSVASNHFGSYFLVNGAVTPTAQGANFPAQTLLGAANIGSTHQMRRRVVLTQGVTYTFTVGLYGRVSGTTQMGATADIPAELSVVRR